MESINSEAKVAEPVITPSEPPAHTHPNHRACAYYPGFKPECEHSVQAEGAFYNEDHLNDIRRTAHKLMAALAAGNHKFTSMENNLLNELRKLTK